MSAPHGTLERRFCLIPQLENYPSFVRGAQTHAGGLFLLAAFVAVFESLNLSSLFPLKPRWQDLISVLILGCWGLPRMVRMGLAIFWAVVFAANTREISGVGGAADWETATRYLQQLQVAVPHFQALSLMTSLLAAMGAAALSWWLLLTLRPRMPVFWLLLVWSILLATCLQFEALSLAGNLAWQGFFIYSLGVFPLCFLYIAQESAMSPWEQLGFVFQGVFVNPRLTYLRSPQLLRSPVSAQDSAICRLKALKLLLWSRLVIGLADAVNFEVFQTWKWPNYKWIGFANYNALKINAAQIWALILINNFTFLCVLTASSGAAVALYRLAGIYIPRGVYRPHRARGYSEYYRRCLFYYSEILIHVFFYPVYELLTGLIRPRKLHLVFSVFLAIFIGGIIFHLIISAQLFMLFAVKDVLSNALSWTPYFAAVAAICCISSLHLPSRFKLSLPWPIQFATNFSLQAVLMTLFQYRLHETWAERLVFFKSLGW